MANAASNRELFEARRRFAELLATQSSRERDWQKFFSECPHVLSNSLPLQLQPEDIVVGGRPGISESDFYFYPKEASRAPCFGAIELKNPSSKILRTPRKNLLDFSATASCAIRQAQKGLQEFRATLAVDPSRLLLMGNQQYIFVIMGLSHELVQKVELALREDQFRSIVSERHCDIIPYDTLLRMYERGLPRRFEFLTLQQGLPSTEIHRHLAAIADADERLFVAANRGWDDSAIHLLSDKPNPNRRFGSQLSTALLWASFYGDYLLVLRLLQEGADVNMTDSLGRGPLWAAAINNHVDVAALLLERGANVEAMNYAGWTYVLLYQRRAMYSEVRQLLARYGYSDDKEQITASALILSTRREELLSKGKQYDDLIPLLREKYLWLHETARKIRAGREVFASGTQGPEEDLRSFVEHMKYPFLVLMKLGVVYCRSGRFDDGIATLSSLLTELGSKSISDGMEDDLLIAHTELGNLHFLAENLALAKLEWDTAMNAAEQVHSESAMRHLSRCLSAIDTGDQAARDELKQTLQRR